jgi:hypothetical protein
MKKKVLSGVPRILARQFFADASFGVLTATTQRTESTAQEASANGSRNLVLVHEAWADGSSWWKVIPLLQNKGLHVVAV